MKIFAGIIVYLILFSQLSNAQPEKEIEQLRKQYETFQYSSLVNKADNLLYDKERFTDQILINIYSLKGASHFAMGDIKNSRKTFRELLKIDNDHQLDNITYSPKILELYNDIKAEFLDIRIPEKGKSQGKNEEIINNDFQRSTFSEFNLALAKSLILPGWGHLHVNNNTKGWILSSASIITLGSMIYFIADANTKENKYLRETNSLHIKNRYDAYNDAYKIKNILIATYSIIWLYSQIDLLFFSGKLGSNSISQQYTNYHLQVSAARLEFTLKLPF